MAAQRLSRRQKHILHWLAADHQRTRGMITSSHQDLVRALECVPPFTRGVLGHEIGLVVDGELRPLVYDHP
jgi:hypothetical protein